MWQKLPEHSCIDNISRAGKALPEAPIASTQPPHPGVWVFIWGLWEVCVDREEAGTARCKRSSVCVSAIVQTQRRTLLAASPLCFPTVVAVSYPPVRRSRVQMHRSCSAYDNRQSCGRVDPPKHRSILTWPIRAWCNHPPAAGSESRLRMLL